MKKTTLKLLILTCCILFSFSSFSQTVYYAKNYGIRTDSSLVDQAAKLQSLINTVNSNGGGIISFPSNGDTYINSLVSLKSNVTIDGNGCTFFTSSSSTAIKLLFIFRSVTNAGFRNASFISKADQIAVARNADNPNGRRNGPTSNVQAIQYKVASSNLVFDNLKGYWLETLIQANDGGLGTAGISTNIKVTNLYTYRCQQPAYIESTNGFYGKNWKFTGWPKSKSDWLNHALYLQKQLTNFTLDGYEFTNGYGTLLNLAGKNTRILNGTLKNCYAAISSSDDYRQGAITVDGLTVDSCYFTFLTTNEAVNTTIKNFTVRRYYGGGSGACFAYSCSNTGGVVTLQYGRIYGSNKAVQTTPFFLGRGKHRMVFDNIQFYDYSTTAMFLTNSSGARHKSIIVKNSRFCYKNAATIPLLFDLRNSDSSLIYNNDFVLNKSAYSSKYVAHNRYVGKHQITTNRYFGFKGLKSPLDEISSERNTTKSTDADPCYTYVVSGVTNSTDLLDSDATDLTGQTREAGVQVYPNPSNGTTNVYLPAKEGAVNITLQDALGRIVQQWRGYTSKSLQLTNLKRGVSLLRVQAATSDKVEVKKIVVQ